MKPILFSTSMVQAILAGRKTQTRRVIEEVDDCYFQSLVLHHTGKYTFVKNSNFNPREEDVIEVKPKYHKGDILWVRETFAKVPITAFGSEYIFKASFDKTYSGGWKPSIFMPKEAARIFLEVTNVRVERVHDISEADAIAEGVEKIADYGTTSYKLYTEPDAAYSDIDAIWSFESLWQSINGKKHPWDSNPWVWVYEFKIIDKPSNL